MMVVALGSTGRAETGSGSVVSMVVSVRPAGAWALSVADSADGAVSSRASSAGFDRSVVDDEPGRRLGPAVLSDSVSPDSADFAPEAWLDTRGSFGDLLVAGLWSLLLGSAGPAEVLAPVSPEMPAVEPESEVLEALDDAPPSESESPVSAAATPLAIATPTPAAIANPLTFATYLTRSIDRTPPTQ
jgi:hypothetical protein